MARRRPTEPAANPARGAVLVIVAVLVGLFLLRNGIDTTTTTTTGSTDKGSSTDSDATTDGGTDTADSSTSTIGTRLPAEVPTIVLNGTTVNGAAKKWSTYLAGKGYGLTDSDGAGGPDATATSVYYAAGFQQEATVVATLIGAPSTSVTPLPTPAPQNSGQAKVVVVLGPDLASHEVPTT
jgi:hypothetical protein